MGRETHTVERCRAGRLATITFVTTCPNGTTGNTTLQKRHCTQEIVTDNDQERAIPPAIPGHRQAARESISVLALPEGDTALRHEKPDTEDAFTPTINRMDDDRTIHVTVPLNGIAEEQIRFDLEKTKLTLTIVQEGKVLKKTLWVPDGMRFFKKKFHDGILEIIFDKITP